MFGYQALAQDGLQFHEKARKKRKKEGKREMKKEINKEGRK